MPESTAYKFNSTKEGEEVTGRVTYSYTGNVAVVAVPNSDTGIVSYVAIYTLTRTAKDARI